MTALQPIVRKVLLAGKPSQAPKYSQTVKLKSGEEIPFADPKATRAMVALMDMQAGLGGAASHFGGPAALAELMSAAYGLAFQRSTSKNWYDDFQIINDAGHCENGIYALKANYSYADLNLESLKAFRSIQSPLTGHGEAHIFPEAVYLSNGPLGSSLPQAQGLAVADALSKTKRLTCAVISDGACMEGEAKEAFAAIPGLAQKGQLAPFVMIISDNNTKLSGRIDEQAYSMQPSFESLNQLGWKVLSLENGNDLHACVNCLEEAMDFALAHPETPVAIHAKTVKGFGVKATTESASGGHGFPLKTPESLPEFIQEIYGQNDIPEDFSNWCSELNSLYQQQLEQKKQSTTSSAPKEKVQVGVTKALIAKRQAGAPIVSVTSDLPGSTGVAGFHKEFPEAVIDVGVAEANMVSVAAGLSKQGFIPIVDTFAQFGVTKGALPLTMASLSEAPMIAIYSHIGFQDAADGASHQALAYLAMSGSIPHVKVHCLSTSEEAEALIGQAIDEFSEYFKKAQTPSSHIFFLGRETFAPKIGNLSHYKLGQAQVLKSAEKPKLLVAAMGALVFQAMEAADRLKEEGIEVSVINPSCMNKIDVTTFRQELEKANSHLLTIEDHQVFGGMGSQIVHQLLCAGVTLKKVRSLGVHSEFGQSAYKALDLYKKHKLDATAIIKAAKTF